jgi:hypothetical protein
MIVVQCIEPDFCFPVFKKMIGQGQKFQSSGIDVRFMTAFSAIGYTAQTCGFLKGAHLLIQLVENTLNRSNF